MRIYLSGMSPSLPPTQPRHQSELAWLYSTMLSPFMKLTCHIVIISIIIPFIYYYYLFTSRDDLAVKSY